MEDEKRIEAIAAKARLIVEAFDKIKRKRESLRYLSKVDSIKITSVHRADGAIMAVPVSASDMIRKVAIVACQREISDAVRDIQFLADEITNLGELPVGVDPDELPADTPF